MKKLRNAHFSIFFFSFYSEFVNVLSLDNFNLYTNMSNLHKGTIKGWPWWTRGPKVYKRNFALFSFFTFFQKGGIIHEIGTYFQKEDIQKIQHFMNEGSDFVKRKSVKENVQNWTDSNVRNRNFFSPIFWQRKVVLFKKGSYLFFSHFTLSYSIFI